MRGQWHYLHRAVDKTGQTIDFLLTQRRDAPTAERFLTKVIRRHGVLEKITIDRSKANAAAIRSDNKEDDMASEAGDTSDTRVQVVWCGSADLGWYRTDVHAAKKADGR